MNTNYFLILIVIGIISSGLIISNSQLSFAQLFGCSEPFVNELVPEWLDEVKICFDDQDKIFELGQEVTIHMYAETNEPAEWIRIHFFHSSQSGFFEEDGIERQNVKDVRIKESPHIINLQDNERIFGTNLEDATHFTINCNDPPCKKPYEKERTFEFSFPGTYYYEITMQTTDAENIYSHFPGIEVFKVLNYDEQLEMQANESILSEKLEQSISKDNALDKENLGGIVENPLIIAIIGIIGIIGAGASILALLFRRSSRSSPSITIRQNQNGNQFTIASIQNVGNASATNINCRITNRTTGESIEVNPMALIPNQAINIPPPDRLTGMIGDKLQIEFEYTDISGKRRKRNQKPFTIRKLTQRTQPN